MKASLDEIHAEIFEIQSRDKAGLTKTSLQQIPEVPEKNWATLKTQLFSGQLQVREMATSPISFQVFAAPSDVAGFKFFNALALLLPIVAIALAFIYSWWLILLALGSMFMLRTAKSFYRTVIFQGVTASEA